MRRYAHSLATISNISWSCLPSEADEVSCRLSEKSGIIACTNCIRAIPIVTSSLKLFQKTRGNNPQKHQTGEQHFQRRYAHRPVAACYTCSIHGFSAVDYCRIAGAIIHRKGGLMRSIHEVTQSVIVSMWREVVRG